MNERNVVINIDTLNLSVGPARPGISDVLAAMIGNAGITGMEVHAERVDDEPRATNGADTSETEAAAEQDTASPTRQDIIDFIQSDDRYTMRTLKSVMEHFGETRETYGLIQEMEADGTLERKVRRRDSAFLLKVTDNVVHAEPQAEPQPEQEAEVTHEDVLDFLKSDERYTMRTFNAIAKKFPHVHRDRLSDLLTDLTIDGDVQTRTRRRDGVTLYEAA